MSVHLAENKIIELFDVTKDDALVYAQEFIDLVESFGGIPTQDVIDNQIPKVFGERLKWRSETVKREIDERKNSTAAAYNAFISNRQKNKW
jgi:hypothetical protein